MPGFRAALVADPDPRWERFATREPYFAVVTDPRFLRASLTDAHAQEFFDSGEALIDAVFRTIELRLAPHFAPTHVLEYGCGAGRLAIPLARRTARRAGSVTAVDRSPAMLGAARREAARQGIANITFESAAALFASPAAASARFDFICCYLVLQRLPPLEGLALLAALLPYLAPGGIGLFQCPYRSRSSRLQRYSRRIRERFPVANGLANLLRRKPFDEPLIASHTYDLDAVLGVFDRAGFAATHVVFDDHHDLASVVILAEAPLAARTTADDTSGPAARAARSPAIALEAAAPTVTGRIDVRDLIASRSLPDLTASAEQYFATLTDTDHQLAKPFSHAAEAPWLLMNMAVLLQALDLTPGCTVLEFGSGSGWLSRFLTQLGCRVVLLDVSPSALQLARDLYRRLPVIGEQPEPVFLPFDGIQVDLPDGSVERIVSFHAFHHAPNPDVIIREFGRLLAPGGIAAFAEPGPQHSTAAQSQFEMRSYGVVENDVHVHEVWQAASGAGFAEMRLSLFHGPPFLVSLTEYEDFLAGGPTTEEWVASTRIFLRNVRNFRLIKAGVEPATSRSTTGLACALHATPAQSRACSGSPIAFDLVVSNIGSASWLPRRELYGGVGLGVRVYDAQRVLLSTEVLGQGLTDPERTIAPGETLRVRVSLPPLAAGDYVVEFDCVASRVTWFSQSGSRPATVTVRITAASS